LIGQTVSHYKILRKLGEGGMGEVYEATDERLHREVALKFLPRYLAKDSPERERFTNEAHTAATLNHPNIATVYEIDEYDGQLFIAMEKISGETIRALIAQELMAIDRVLDIGIQVAEGLAIAHEKMILHRDIKPENIMVTSRGQAKIMDFGLAKAKDSSKLTKAGSTLGTINYMSPEQIRTEKLDQRSDLFSLGVVLYEMLTGTRAFQGEHEAAIAYSIVNEDPLPLLRYNNKVTPEIERIVFKALCKEVKERYQHVDDLLADLKRERKNLEYAKSGYIKGGSVKVKERLHFGRKGNRWILIGAGAVIVGLFVLVNPFEIHMGSPENSRRLTIAVGGFEDLVDPDNSDLTGVMLANLLTTAISQVPGIEVISQERLYEIQNELGEQAANSISQVLAMKIAQKAGVGKLIIGSIVQKEPTLSITVRVIDVHSGTVVSSKRFQSYEVRQLFDLVDSLTVSTWRDLNIEPASLIQAKPVMEVTTRSIEAYRAYTEGVSLTFRLSWDHANGALKRALELDPSFAMAHLWLGRNWSQISFTYADGRDHLQRAYELRDNVTEPERLQILADYHIWKKSYAKTIDAAQHLIDKYHNWTGYRTLSSIYNRQGKFEEALRALEKHVSLDPSDKLTLSLLAYQYAWMGHRAEAVKAASEYIRLYPGEPNPYDTRGDIDFIFDQFDSALVWFQKADEVSPVVFSRGKLHSYALIRGDYGNLPKTSPWPQNVDRHRGLLRKLWEAGEGDYSIAYEIGMKREMIQKAGEFVELIKNQYRDSLMYHQSKEKLAWAYIVNGDSVRAYQELLEIRHHSNFSNPEEGVRYTYVAGILAFERGNFDEAYRLFQSVFNMRPPRVPPNLPYAICLLKTGRIDKAISQLKRLTRWYYSVSAPLTIRAAPLADYNWRISSVKSHYWLGVAYEQKGKSEEALKEYLAFLNLWKDADFAPKEIKRAKERVAALKGL